MKKASILMLMLGNAVVAFAQSDLKNENPDSRQVIRTVPDNGVVAYGTNFYSSTSSSDKEILRVDQVIDRKAYFDKMAAASLDKSVSRDEFDDVHLQLNAVVAQHEGMMDNSETMNQLRDLKYLMDNLRSYLRGNENYRQNAYRHAYRVVKVENENWDTEIREIVIQEAVIDMRSDMERASRDDKGLAGAFAMAERNNPRFEKCAYQIVSDPKLIKADPGMEVYVTDYNHFVSGKKLYRYKGYGVVADFKNRTQESDLLRNWLMASATDESRRDHVKYMSFAQHVKEDPTTLAANMYNMNNWYVFVFHKNKLYYVNTLTNCSVTTNIPAPAKI